jgi:hypothetical protein
MLFCSVSMVVMALPSDAFGARLKETVIDGNCPWCVMESGSVVVSKWEKALRGMALLGVELVIPAELAPLVDAVVPAAMTRAGGAMVFALGVYRVDAVSAFEPADVEPLPDDVEAPAPVVPAAALA